MSLSAGSVSRESVEDSVLMHLLDEITDRVQAGGPVDVEAYAQAHPEYADRLRQILPAVQMMVNLGHSAASGETSVPPAVTDAEPESATLGDFRILREVGRGGMGVVYEAEQISLGRRVALKILPLAATMDPRYLHRFHNEARAAASLEHPHIVPVYGVGCERGVHHYAMKFIDGRSLAALIRERSGGGPWPSQENAAACPHPPTGSQDAETARVAAARTERTPADQVYFRRVAEWGVQAAEALEYAHGLGIVHRDVKPANLMIDAQGKLWVTDFGLARTATDTGLTMTGDLVGTLRYMSPEQALAKHGLVDHRTDVYSLGATLYELLTLRPVFTGSDRQELLRQIAFEEPKSPRRINRAVPGELETIVLKAIDKNSADRFASAQELADDLERFLIDEPIQARRPPLWLRLRKWSRRHRPLVASLAVGMVTLLVVAAVLAFNYQRRLVETEQGVTAALVQAETLVAEGDQLTDHPQRWQATARLAQAALQKADELLAAGVASRDIARRVETDRAAVEATIRDSGLLVELDRIRLEKATVREGGFDSAHAAPLYAKAMADYGIDLAVAKIAGARIRDSRLREPLLAALVDWWRASEDKRERQQIEQVLEAADPANQFRARWREAMHRRDGATLVKLATQQPIEQLAPSTVCNRAEDLMSLKQWATAERLLKAAQAHKPADFWLNHDLGRAIHLQGKKRAEEAVGYLRAALALRSDSPGVHLNLGTALLDMDDLDGAMTCFQAAIAINRTYAQAHCNLAFVLQLKGKLDDAIAGYHTAIGLKPNLFEAHNNLGFVLQRVGKLEQAIAECRVAIRLDSKRGEPHMILGLVLERQSKHDEAIAQFREAINIAPYTAHFHYELGAALERMGKWEQAIASYKAAIDRDKAYVEAHFGLGTALSNMRKLDEAIAEFRQTIQIKEDHAEAHNNLGLALCQKSQWDEAIAEFRKAIRFKKGYAEAHHNLGQALYVKGKPDEAIAELHKAIRLKRKYATAYFNLGLALEDKADLDGATSAYRTAIGLKKDYAEALCNLGMVLVRQGHFRDGLKTLKEGHELGLKNPGWPYKSADWVRDAERLVELDTKLAKVLKGEIRPANIGECVSLAQLCQEHKGLYKAAVGFYTKAFGDQPKLAGPMPTRLRYDAARAAALAGCGRGTDANQSDDRERARLRNQAHDWLHAELAAWGRLCEKQPEKVRMALAKSMQHWLENKDFAGVRGDAVAKLPAGERRQWDKLWKEAEARLQRAAKP
jgi:serine/threonine protein kinase/tetratricopeptide (TPR) repeat protein